MLDPCRQQLWSPPHFEENTKRFTTAVVEYLKSTSRVVIDVVTAYNDEQCHYVAMRCPRRVVAGAVVLFSSVASGLFFVVAWRGWQREKLQALRRAVEEQ